MTKIERKAGRKEHSGPAKQNSIDFWERIAVYHFLCSIINIYIISFPLLEKTAQQTSKPVAKNSQKDGLQHADSKAFFSDYIYRFPMKLSKKLKSTIPCSSVHDGGYAHHPLLFPESPSRSDRNPDIESLP
jgi:hypothetical protein